jgi:broad specificity phosphatase PhoE
MRVVLLRHAATAWTLTGRHTGRTDLDLTLTGENEARASAAMIQRVVGEGAPDVVYSSPRKRALRTAELVLGPSVVPEVNELIAEFDYGSYEGLTSTEIRKLAPSWSIWEDGCPGGESVLDVAARVERFIELLLTKHAQHTVCVVSHGHLLRILTARMLGLAPRLGQLFSIKTTSVAELVRNESRFVLSRWNLTR